MYQKILVPIDGSPTSKRGLIEAIKLVKNQGGHLRLFHMVDERIIDCGYAAGTYGSEIIDSDRETGNSIVAEAEAMARREGVEPETVLVESMKGNAAESILKQATEWPADLIVMGTHGRRGLVRLALGSDAESVVREAPVPVLLVHDTLHEDHSVIQKAAPEDSAGVLYA